MRAERFRLGRVVNVWDIDESNFNMSSEREEQFNDAETDSERSNDVQSNSQCKDSKDDRA